MIRDIRRCVNSCDIYQKIKNRMEVLVEKLKLSEVPEKLSTHLTVDFITKLPLVAEKNAILVVCNRLLKNNTFCSNNRKNISRRVGKVVQR